MGHKLKPINMKDTWVPGSHRILKHKHPPGFSHWQLCLSHFLRALGSDAVGDLQNDTWPWRLEFLVWRVRIGLDWTDFWFRLSFRRKQNKNEIYRWYLWLPRSFSQLLFARTSKITWSSRQGWQKTLLSRCGKRLKDLEAIHQHEATIDRFFQRDFVFKHA